MDAPRELVPGDVILLRGMSGFWPMIELVEPNVAGGMRGEVLGPRLGDKPVILVIGTMQTRYDVETGGHSAILVLAPNVGPCWTRVHGLFTKGLGNGVLL